MRRRAAPRRGRAALAASAVAAVAAVVATVVAITRAARRALAAPTATADAVVVFGAALYRGAPTPLLKARLDLARELHRRGLAPLLVCSGGPQEARVMCAYLARSGVPAEALREDGAGVTTRRTIARLVSADGGVGTVIAVTSAYHARRVLSEARRQGLMATVAAPAATARRGPLRRRVRERAREVPAVWWYKLRGPRSAGSIPRFRGR